jgi:hypothetical protein
MKIEKTFTDCTLVFLEKTFDLRQVEELDSLNEWLSQAQEIEVDSKELAVLPIFQQLLKTNVTNWNEQDLSLHFIGPIFSLINFTAPYRFNLFAERKIEADVTNSKSETYRLFGKPDEMIASGFREPESPYFCFQEYKRETDPNGDPIGQVLAAMLVAQTIHQNNKPIFGAYVLGRDWYFLILDEKNYSISRGFDATTEQIYDIYKTLKTLKNNILSLTA